MEPSSPDDLRFHPSVTCNDVYFPGQFGSQESLSSLTKMQEQRGRHDSVESLSSIGGSSSKSSQSLTSQNSDVRATQKYAHISNEYVRLTELLEALTGDELKRILQKRLQKKEARVIVALSALLPRCSFPAATRLHCVRCHKTFDPREHSKCVLRHPNSKVVKIRQSKETADFRCHACGKEFRLIKMMFYDENVNSYLSGICFSGSHTTDVRDVTLDGSVKTCEEYGCVEVYV